MYFRRARLFLVLWVLSSSLAASAADLTVTVLSDNAGMPPAGSLRERYTAANANDRLVFAPGLDGGTIELDTTLVIAKSITIDATGLPNSITLSGGRVFRPILVGTGITVQLSGFTVRYGYATVGGGGIENGGTLTLDRMTLRDNISSGLNGAGCGGGICNQSTGLLTINRSTIVDNISFFLGGGIGALDGGTLTVTNSLIANNESGNTGGGICIRTVNTNATSTLTNVTVTLNQGGSDGNASVDGVGFVKSGAASNTAVIRNSTIARNTGSNYGLISQGTLSIGNSIVWGNSFPDIAQGTSIGANLYGTQNGYTSAPSDLSGVDPKLSPLGAYGGPTETLALLPSSPAIDAGAAAGAPTLDQRGVARSAVDIGAFESQGFSFSLSGDDQNARVGTAYAQPLGVHVVAAAAEPVAGGQVTLTPPGSGARLTIGTTILTIDALGNVSQSVAANLIVGDVNVAVTAMGATPAAFTLHNRGSAMLSPATLPPAIAGESYQQNVSASGGTAPYAFTVTDGALPPGMSLTLAGSLSGTPTTAGAYDFIVTATDSSEKGGPFASSRAYTLDVACPTINVSALPDGVVGSAYAENALAAPVTAYVWSIADGALPAGLSLSPEGAVSGTPEAPGVASFTLQATGFGTCSGSVMQTRSVACPHCEIDGVCIAAGALDPASECRRCDPFMSTTAYSAAPAGIACADDGLSCTTNVCDAAGMCVHAVSGGCLIEGACVATCTPEKPAPEEPPPTGSEEPQPTETEETPVTPAPMTETPARGCRAVGDGASLWIALLFLLRTTTTDRRRRRHRRR